MYSSFSREGYVLQPHQHIKHRYDYIFHPNIELPTPSEKRKGVHRGDKCRVLDFVSADFDAPSVVHRRITIVCHHDKDKKKRKYFSFV